MALLHLKFEHKVFVVTFVLAFFFLLSTLFSQHNIANVSEQIEQLKKKNEEMQLTLVLLNELERLKRYTYEYTVSGNEELVEPIDSIFEELSLKQIQFSSLNEEFRGTYERLAEHLQKYKESFDVAKQQIPLSLQLRKQLRDEAQATEDLLSQFKEENIDSDVWIESIFFRKAILEVEKGIVRYFETDNVTYMLTAKEALKNAKVYLKKLETMQNKSKSIEPIKEAFFSFEKSVKKTIEHYRTYSMLTKVVIPGDVYEVNHYAQDLKSFTLKEIGEIKTELDYYLHLNAKINLYSSIAYIFLIFIGLYFVMRIILAPIRNLTDMFEKLIADKENVTIPEYEFDDEIGKLIIVATEYKSISKKTKELLKQTQDYQENLEKKVQEEIAVRREREKALIQQSKLASMGEMIGAIAHQWRQPLNELTIRIQKLKYNYEKDEIDEAFIAAFIEKNRKTIEFMSKTIDDFRNFFRIDKEKQAFEIKNAIAEIINIQNAQLTTHHIEVSLEGEEFTYNGFKSEFQQVIMNIISNAKDAFVARGTQNPHIGITIRSKEIYIQDNGGGIEEKILERVFEPYFTTKQQGEGTGMGLYMSKMIIEDNMHGKITIANKDGGTLVTIKLYE